MCQIEDITKVEQVMTGAAETMGKEAGVKYAEAFVRIDVSPM